MQTLDNQNKQNENDSHKHNTNYRMMWLFIVTIILWTCSSNILTDVPSLFFGEVSLLSRTLYHILIFIIGCLIFFAMDFKMSVIV